jgi:hypothetical protein
VCADQLLMVADNTNLAATLKSRPQRATSEILSEKAMQDALRMLGLEP